MNDFCQTKATRERALRIFFGLLTAAWCCVIFRLSAQNGDESSETSGSFIRFFCELAVPKFSGFDGARRAEFVEGLQFIVRKCAHFTAYMILAAISLQFFRRFERMKKPREAGAAALIFSFVYASSDEFHQLFVPDRSAQFRDVLIDTGGAMCGIIITLAVWKLVRIIKKSLKKKSAEDSLDLSDSLDTSD
jgi:hypothetical protein